MTQLGNDLRNTNTVGIQGHDHIQFFFTGQGHQCVKFTQTFALQKLRIAGIAMDNGCIRQKRTQFLTAGIVFLHDGNRNTALEQCGCQIMTNTAGTAEHNAADSAGNNPQIFQ